MTYRYRLLLLACSALGVITCSSTHAATGDLLKTFNFGAQDVVADPSRSLIYASVPSTNSIDVFSTSTLTLVKTIPIGSNPLGIALSPDDSRLYVVRSGATTGAIGVVDLNTLTALPSLNAPQTAYDVAVGNGGRLYATTSNGIMQFDTGTGAYVTTFPGYPNYRTYGQLTTSPDHNTLFLTDFSTSPHYLQRFDISTGTGSLVQERTLNAGGNGNSTVSHNGLYVVTDNNYTLVELSTSNINSLVGTYDTGPYPSVSAFSMDDSRFFAATYGNRGGTVYQSSTFTSIGSFALADDATSMVVDNSNRYLFVTENSKVEVFSTGVPEPGVPAFLATAVAAFGLVRRRRKASA